MRVLSQLDYGVILVYLVVIFISGIWLTKKASKSVEDFFVGGRSMPWWLLGVSMAATNFSIDTPIAVSKFVLKEGIGGVWFLWSSAISAIFVTLFFSRYWRRSGVLTDAELVELRYEGSSAKFLRLFKGIYFGIIFNVFIMGWVFLSLGKVLEGVTDLNVNTAMLVSVVIVFLYSIASGFYGVVVTDFFQYFLALFGSIFLAWYSLDAAGGLGVLLEKIPAMEGKEGFLHFFPSSDSASLPLETFLVYLFIQWWAHKYADGGGKHIQRMLSAKNESHAFYGSATYAFLTYIFQIWPWVITSLCSLVVLGNLADPEMAYPTMMARVLPHGLLGLVVVCLIGAFMSTIDTHLNLGASYMVNDIYKRFLVPDRDQKHYVFVSRVTMFLLLAFAYFISTQMTSVASAWKFLLTFASGAGLTWIIRWFWWRANAYTEISGMLSSGLIASYIQWYHPSLPYGRKLLIIVGISTFVWLIVTYLTKPVSESKLEEFVKKVQPLRPGFARIYKGLNVHPASASMAALYFILGIFSFFGLNFAIGSFFFAGTLQALSLLVVSLIAGFLLFGLVQKEKRDLEEQDIG